MLPWGVRRWRGQNPASMGIGPSVVWLKRKSGLINQSRVGVSYGHFADELTALHFQDLPNEVTPGAREIYIYIYILRGYIIDTFTNNDV